MILAWRSLDEDGDHSYVNQDIRIRIEDMKLLTLSSSLRVLHRVNFFLAAASIGMFLPSTFLRVGIRLLES